MILQIFKDPEKMAQQKEQQEMQINSMLSQLLDQNARARLNTLKISKPEKAEMVIVNHRQRSMTNR